MAGTDSTKTILDAGPSPVVILVRPQMGENIGAAARAMKNFGLNRLRIVDPRDGAQTSGVDFSVEDKRVIAEALDRLGADFVEGGWPGANPTDSGFFQAPPKLKHAKFTAFGMNKRPGRSADNDPGPSEVVNASFMALLDSITYKLFKDGAEAP